MVLDDALASRLLVYLADRYLPVMSDWVDTRDVAAAFAVAETDIERRYERLLEQGLIEVSPPDGENTSSAALITVRGLLAIGRAP